MRRWETIVAHQGAMDGVNAGAAASGFCEAS